MAAHRIKLFDIWRPNYGGASVTVYISGTTTKASLYSDLALTTAAANPQTLDSQTIDDIVYGKFAAPVYTSSDYYLSIDGANSTGVEQLPLYDLIGEDASKATVTVPGSSTANELEDIIARSIHVRDYGTFLPTSDPLASTATNDTTLDAALAAAASAGGSVRLPPGTFQVTDFTLSADVQLVGAGENATILVSQKAGTVCTVSGDRAGFVDMTLDGSSLVSGSTGILAVGRARLFTKNFRVKRFETGWTCRGLQKALFINTSVENCTNGFEGHGDLDGGSGTVCKNNLWLGGEIKNCSTVGVEWKYIDAACWHNRMMGVTFDTNTGTALNISGARYTELHSPNFVSNTTTLAIADGSDSVIGFNAEGGVMSGGAVTITGTAQDVAFRRMEISDVDFTLTAPGDNILFIDCIEDSLVTIAGSGAKFLRQRTNRDDHPGSSGVTTDATQTEAWSYELAPGEAISMVADIVANRRDGEERAMYSLRAYLHRPGSTLAYNTQTANFTVGAVLTGGTSAATARIVADSDSGATGTLTLRSITGTFQNGEAITDSSGGAAVVNGTLGSQNAALIGSVAAVSTAYESDAALDATLGATSTRAIVAVTGIASETWDWTANVQITSNG